MKNIIYKIGYYLSVILHYLVFIGLAISPIYAIINEPFWIWLPISTLVIRIMFSRNVCPLSLLEYYFESKFRNPKEPKFMKYWIRRPYRHARDYYANTLKRLRR
jgi:hypothetical protein